MSTPVSFNMFDEQEDSLPVVTDIEVHVTENNSIYVTSREIALKSGQEHKNVLAAIKRIIDKDKVGITEKMFHKTTYKDSRNRDQPEYYVNQAGFSILVSNIVFGDTDKKIEFSIALQTKNEEIRNKLNRIEKQMKAFQFPTREAMVAQGLIAANEIINEQKNTILNQQQAIEQKDQEIAANQPAVDFANAVSASTDCILVRQLADHISLALTRAGYKNKVGQNKMFEWLRAKGYLKKSSTRDENLPTKRCMEMGLMEFKTTPIEHKTLPGQTWNSRTPLVTAKGLKYFTLKMLKIYEEGGNIDDDTNKKNR